MGLFTFREPGGQRVGKTMHLPRALYEFMYRTRNRIRDLALMRDIAIEGRRRRNLSDTTCDNSPGTDSETIESCRRWLEDYIARPHPELGRSGDVCPFVRPALKKDKLRLVVCDHVIRPDMAVIRRSLLWEGMALRKRLDPADRDSELNSVVLVFPNLVAGDAAVLHDAFMDAYQHLNRRGIMLAVFYPGYDKPGLRNREFRLYQSPVPAAALRPMALHDILFVSHDREGFLEYHRQFVKQYRQGKVAESSGFIGEFERAEQRFGSLLDAAE